MHPEEASGQVDVRRECVDGVRRRVRRDNSFFRRGVRDRLQEGLFEREVLGRGLHDEVCSCDSVFGGIGRFDLLYTGQRLVRDQARFHLDLGAPS